MYTSTYIYQKIDPSIPSTNPSFTDQLLQKKKKKAPIIFTSAIETQ